MIRSILFLGFLLAFQSACSHPNDALNADTISVSGLGEVEVKSDQATLNVQISAENKVLATAKANADKHYQAFLDLLEQHDLNTDQLTLVQLNMNPMYEWRNEDGKNERYQTGYLVARSLSYELNDLNKLPVLLEAFSNMSQININSISRGLQDPSAVIEQATAKAAEDAKRRAQFIAEQFGRSLGEVSSVTAHHSNVPFADQPMAKGRVAEAMAYDAPEEHLGQQKVSASLNVVFKLK